MISLLRKLKFSIPHIVGFLIVFFFLWLQSSPIPWLINPIERIEALAYDARLNLTIGKRQLDPRVVIIDIDEKSLQQVGHWPWPRDVIGELVNRIFAQGAAVIGFDVVFPEAEMNSAQEVIDQLQKIETTAQADSTERELINFLDSNRHRFDKNQQLAQSFESGDVVLGFVVDYREGEPIGRLPEPIEIINNSAALDALSLYATENYTANIPSLQNATPFAGFFSLRPDIDGIIRRTPLLASINNQIYPSLSLELLRVFKLVDEIEVITATIAEKTVIEGVRVGEYLIPTDSSGRANIPFRGGWGSFPYISATDLLAGKSLPYSLEGAVVLIGATAHGLFDLRSTPTEPVYPGVEVHANIISGALDQQFTSRPAWGTAVNFLIVLFMGSIIAFVLPRLTPYRMLLNSLAGIFTITLLNFWIWQEMKFIIDLALPIIMIFSISLFNISYGFFYESSSKNRLKGMFGQYVPPELVKEMSENPDSSYGFEGESREMSVLFCDIRSFTSISERLSAEDLKTFLNSFFTPMTQTIFEHRGTIDKYVGDMIMAFWGAPLEDEQHAIHSVEAALSMLDLCEQLGQTLALEFHTQPIHVGIGINTGKMNVGDMGSIYRRSYTVLGDTVNLGSRLEALTKYYGTSLLIGEDTYHQLNGAYLCREFDKVLVKGKHEPISIFHPIKLLRDASAEELEVEEKYRYCRELYLNRDWYGAEQAFLQLKEIEQSVICDRYLDRIEGFRTSPPAEEWTGVFEHHEKSGG